MKIMSFFIIVLLLLVGCRPSDFTSLNKPSNSFNGRVNFQHDKFLSTNCAQCHENKRPVTIAPAPIHGNGADCITCHSAALNSAGIRSWKNFFKYSHVPTPSSCIQCHGENTRPITAPHAQGQWGEKQDCSSCHGYPKWFPAIKFDHNKPLTSCVECHQNGNDARPLGARATLHPSIFYENLNSYFSAIAIGDNTILSNSSPLKSISYTSPLNSIQADSLYRLTHISLIKQNDSMQIECILCHNNNTNSTASNSKKWTSAVKSGANSSVTFTYSTHTPTPNSCIPCHEIQRPTNHTVANSMNASIPGMDKGDCQSCHGFSTSPSPVISDWRDLMVAFNHDTRLPPTCIGCHSGSIPLNQKVSSTNTFPSHPVPRGTYYKIDCVKCHTYDPTLTPPFAFSPARSWANIAFDYKTHLAADGLTTPTTCIQCHKTDNNSLPITLINDSHTKGSRLNNDCATCHMFDPINKWQRFKSPGFNHALLDPTPNADRCDSCHKSAVPFLSSIPKLASSKLHIPTIANADCSSCHTGSLIPNWKMPYVAYTHAPSDSCSSCHNMANPNNLALPSVVQKGTNHFPTGTMECSACHTQSNTSSYTTFKNSIFSHANTSGAKCSTCHNDSNYIGTVTKQLPLPLGTKHLNFQQANDCNTCHISTSLFTGMSVPALNVTYSHNLATDNDCNSCHMSVSGFAKGTNATTSHMNIPFAQANGITTTTPVQCSTCHQEVNGLGIATVIKTAPDFKIHTAANTKMFTTSASDTRCNICHDGAAATGKTINDFNGPHGSLTVHPSLGTLQCVSCHAASLTTNPKYASFAAGGFVHTSTQTNNNTSCNSCHAGSNAIATTSSAFAGHVPSSKECVFCHTASLATFTNFTSGNYDHSDNVNCKTCHADASVSSVTQKTVANVSTNTTLNTIHTGAGTAATCNTCHSNTANFTTWKVHTNTTTTTSTTCNTCHTGLANTYGLTTSAYTGRPTGHIPTSGAQCVTCHSSVLTKAPPFINFSGAQYHVNNPSPGACTSCHTATTTVIHTTNAATTCNTCHTNSVGYTTWKIHTQAATSSNTSCNTCHLISSSPLLVLANRSTSASYSHFLINKSNGSPAECSTCHQTSMSNTTTWPSFTATSFSGGLTHTNAGTSGVVITANCTSCHNATYSSSAANTFKILPSTTASPALHLTLPTPTATPTQVTQCDTCHKDATFASWKGMTLSNPTSTNVQYAHNINTTTDTSCSSCHAGISGFAEGTSHYKNTLGVALHMSTTAQCSSCHQGADAGGVLTVKLSDFKVHSNVSTQTETRCNVCHDGGNAIAKTTAAFTGHPTIAARQCVECHQSSLGSIPKYLSFAGGNAHDSTSTNNFTECISCHLTNGASGGSIQNINNSPGYQHFATGTVQCAICHTASINSVTPALGFKNFTGGKFHSLATTSGISATNCASCHNSNLTNGTTSFKKLPVAHLTLRAPIGASSDAQCSTCHSVTNNNSGAINLWTGMKIANSLNGAIALKVTYTHAAGDNGNCVTCHTGSTGFAEGTSTTPGTTHLILPKIANVNVNCDACHNINTASGAVWKGMAVSATARALITPVTVSYNHSSMGTATCTSCHTGSATVHGQAVGTAYAIQSPYKASPVAHISISGSDCKGCHLVTINGGASTTLPVVKTFAAYESFLGGLPQDHSTTTTNCLSCHWSGNGSTGTFLNAPSSSGAFKHINITTAATVSQCSNCHQASMITAATGFTTSASGFAGGKFHENASSSALSASTCNSCHNSGTLTYGASSFKKLPTEGTNHLTRTATGTECSTCHTVTNDNSSVTNSWTGMLSESANPIKVSYTHNLTNDSTCNSCHSTTNKAGFATGYTNASIHTANTAVQCSTCHQVVSGTSVTSKTTPDFKIHDAANTANDTKCNVCHLNAGAITKFNNYTNSGFTHFPYVNGTSYAECQTCHQASIAIAAPAVKYGNFTGGLFHSTTINSGVPTTKCATCHVATGTAFTGVTKIPATPAAHLTLPIPTTGTTDCITCHATTGWTGTVYNNPTSVKVNYPHNVNAITDASCTTCHTGAVGYATGKTGGVTIHGTIAGTSQQCSACHILVSGTGSGSTATIKTTGNFLIHDSTNITTSKNRCNVCHLDTISSSATVASTKFFDANKTFVHFPIKTTMATFTECSTCHQVSIGSVSAAPFLTNYSFAGGILHSISTSSSIISSTCATCHNGAYTYGPSSFKKLPATHLGLTATTGVTANAECSSCHKVTNDSASIINKWSGMAIANSQNPIAVALNVTYQHKIGDTSCSTCHQGSTGFAEGNLSAGNGHLPIPFAPLTSTAAQCSACHLVGTTGGATTLDSWKNWRRAIPQVTYTHNTAAITSCSNCHTNAAGFSKGMAFDTTPGGHPNTTGLGQCSVCHSYTSTSAAAGTTTYTDFKNPRDHRAAANCLSCHYNSTTNTFTNINANASYKHFPILNAANSPVQCSTCHTASLTTYINFTGGALHANAIATNITTAAKCTTCHTTSYSTTLTSFKVPTATHLTIPSGTNCDTCHNINTGAGVTWNGMPLKGTATTVTYDHVTMGSATCNSCHTGTTSSSGLAEGIANVAGKYAGSSHLTLPSGNDCNSCHQSKTAWTGIKTNPVNINYTHTVLDQNSCITCHTGSINSNPAQHGGAIGTGYAVVATGNAHMAILTADCKGCHAASMTTYSSFAGGLTTDHRNGADCISCHWNSSTNDIANYPTSPGFKHFPIYSSGTTPAQCSSCHSASQGPGRNYDNYTGGSFHANSTLASVSSNACSSCHNSGLVTYESTIGNFRKFPTTHLNLTQPTVAAPAIQTTSRGECNVCHTVTNNITDFENSWKTWTAPLAKSNPVSFSNSAVFTTTLAHGFLVNDPISFSSTASLPAQLASGITYYVKTTPTSTTFTISATAGGVAITFLNSSSIGKNYVQPILTFNAPTFATVSNVSVSQTTTASFTSGSSAITTGTALTLAVGDPVQLTGTIPVNLSTNVIYYIKTIAGTSITLGVSNNNGAVGTVVVPASTNTANIISSNIFTTSAAHGITAASLPIAVTIRGSLPSGLVADQVYYVSSVPTTTKFTLSSAVPASMSFSSTSINIGLNTSATAAASSVTYAKAVAAVVTYAGHGLIAGDLVRFNSTGTLPAGIAEGQSYQVSAVTNSSTFTIKSIPVTLLGGTTYGPSINVLSAVLPTGTISLNRPQQTVYQIHSAANDTNCNACHTGGSGYAKGAGNYNAANGTTALHISVGANQCSACHSGTAGTGTMTYIGFTGGTHHHTTGGTSTFSVTGAYHANEASCIACHNNYTSQPASASTVQWLNKETGIKNACLGCHVAAFGFNGLHLSTSNSNSGLTSISQTTTGTTFGVPTTATIATATQSGRSKCLSCHSYGTSGTGTTINPSDGNRPMKYTPKTAQ